MGPLHDIIYEHPQWFLVVIVSWIAISVWIVSLVNWMIMGEVDALFGFAGIGLALVFGYFSFMPPLESLRPFTALATVLTVVIFPILRKALNDRELLKIDIEAMENAYELLKLRPDNDPMRFKLAKLLYERGHIESGLGIGAEALKGMPEKVFNEEHRMYSRWKRQNPQVRPDKTVTCVDCGQPNHAWAIDCERCGQPYLLDRARGVLIGRQFGKKLIAGWIAGLLALIGIPAASSLPPTIAIVTMVAIMVAAAVVVWLALRPPPARASK